MAPHTDESRGVGRRRGASSAGSESGGAGGGSASQQASPSPAASLLPLVPLSPSPPPPAPSPPQQPTSEDEAPAQVVPPFHLPALPPMAHLQALANSLPPLPEVPLPKPRGRMLSPPELPMPRRPVLPGTRPRTPTLSPSSLMRVKKHASHSKGFPAAAMAPGRTATAAATTIALRRAAAAEEAAAKARPAVAVPRTPTTHRITASHRIRTPGVAALYGEREESDDEDYAKLFSDYKARKQDALPPLPLDPVVLAPFVRVNPNPLVQPGAPDFLPVDHNLPQLLRQVTGARELSSVQSVRVRVIAREMSLQRLCLYMPRLRELHLDGSLLGSLRDLGCGLSCLEVLSVSNCGLDSLDGTFGLTTLKELYAVDNKIDDASLCTSLPHITVIDLKRNIIQDLGYIGFLSICSDLRNLSLAGCPVSELPGYRPALINMLPQLSHLDGIAVGEGRDVSDEEGFFEDTDDVDEESEEIFSNAVSREGSAADSAGVTSAASSDAESPLRGRVSLTSSLSSSSAASSASAAVASRSSSEEEAACGGAFIEPGPAGGVADPAEGMSFRGGRATAAIAVAAMRAPDALRPTSAVSSRPTSALLRPGSAAGASRAGSARRRPTTAGSTASGTTSADECVAESRTPMFRSDAPSALTSGGVVCGNLATALRTRRQRAAAVAAAAASVAWSADDSDSDEDARGAAAAAPAPAVADARPPASAEASVASNTTSSGAVADVSLGSSVMEEGTESSMASDIFDQDIEIPSRLNLLESSRRWRRVFNSYREKNRDKWEREVNEEINEGQKKEEKSEEGSIEKENVEEKMEEKLDIGEGTSSEKEANGLLKTRDENEALKELSKSAQEKEEGKELLKNAHTKKEGKEIPESAKSKEKEKELTKSAQAKEEEKDTTKIAQAKPKEKERYRPPPCCAMMHRLRNPERNWNSESSGEIDSSDSERISTSRGHQFMRY